MKKIGQIPLYEYNQKMNPIELFDNKICKFLYNQNQSQGLKLSFGFPTFIIHDIETVSYVLNKCIFQNIFLNIDGQFTQIFAENWITVDQIQVFTYYIQLDVTILMETQQSINIAINAIISTFYKNYLFTNLSNQQQQQAFQLIGNFEVQQKRYSKYLQLQTLKQEEIVLDSKKFCSNYFQHIKNQRFTIIATSMSEHSCQLIIDAITSSCLSIINNIQDYQTLSFQKLEQPKNNIQIIINENLYTASSQQFETCTIESLLYITDTFTNQFIKSSFVLITQWINNKNGPLLIYLKNQLIPEQIINQLETRLVTYEKYIFLEIIFRNVPEIFSEVLTSSLKNILEQPLANLLCRSKQVFDQILETNFQETKNQFQYHSLLVDDILFNSFDQIQYYSLMCNSPHNLFGPSFYQTTLFPCELFDIWQGIVDSSSFKQYKNNLFRNQSVNLNQYVKKNQPYQLIDILKNNNFEQSNKFQLKQQYRKSYFGISICISSQIKIIKLLMQTQDIFGFIQQLFIQTVSQTFISYQIIATQNFSPYQTIMNIIKPSRRQKSSLDDEALEIFNQSNFNLSPFSSLYQKYKSNLKNNSFDSSHINDTRNIQKIIIQKYKAFNSQSVDPSPNFSQPLSFELDILSQSQQIQLQFVNKFIQQKQQLSKSYDKSQLEDILDLQIIFDKVILTKYIVINDSIKLKSIQPLNEIVSFNDSKLFFIDVNVKQLIIFDCSHISQDLQYLVIIMVNMYNSRTTDNINISFIDNQIIVSLNGHSIQSIQLVQELFLNAISQKFCIDDFAVILQMEVFLGLMLLLQQIIFSSKRIKTELILSQFNAYSNNYQDQSIELQFKQFFIDIQNQFQIFSKRLLVLFNPIVFQDNQHNSIIFSQQLLTKTQIQLNVSSLTDIQVYLLAELLTLILAKECSIADFKLKIHEASTQILIIIQSSIKYSLNFLHLIQHNLQECFLQKYKFIIYNKLLQKDINLENINFDQVFQTLPTNFTPYCVNTAFYLNEKVEDITKIDNLINRSKINEGAFNLPLNQQLQMVNFAQLIKKAIPANPTKLVSTLQNQTFNGVQIKSTSLIGFLKEKFIKLSQLQDQTATQSDVLLQSSIKAELNMKDSQFISVAQNQERDEVSIRMERSVEQNYVCITLPVSEPIVVNDVVFQYEKHYISQIVQLLKINAKQVKTQQKDDFVTFYNELPSVIVKQEKTKTNYSQVSNDYLQLVSPNVQKLVQQQHLKIIQTIQYRLLLVQQLLCRSLNIPERYEFYSNGVNSFIKIRHPNIQQVISLPLLYDSFTNFQNIKGLRSKGTLQLKNKVYEQLFIENGVLDDTQHLQLIDDIILENYIYICDYLNVDTSGSLIQLVQKLEIMK